MEFEQALDAIIGIFARSGINNTTDLAVCTFGQRLLIAECVRFMKIEKGFLTNLEFQKAITTRLRQNDSTEIFVNERVEAGEILLH